MTDMIEKTAYAKINLGLDITGKRPDGYHEIRSIMQTVDITDRITLSKSEMPGITLTANYSWLPTDSRNLMVKAAEVMFERLMLPGGLRMTLEKAIPVGGGMAGGSADCAAVINGIAELYHIRLTKAEKEELAAGLGADVGFCLYGGTMLCEGIGEKMTALPACPDFSVLIIKPPFSVPTKEIYKGFDEMYGLDSPTAVCSTDSPASVCSTGNPSSVSTTGGPAAARPKDVSSEISSSDLLDISAQVEAIRAGDRKALFAAAGNALEPVTFALHPSLPEIKRYLLENGAFYAMMSGSGPTMLGFYESREKAENACRRARRKYKNHTVRVCRPVNLQEEVQK